MSVEALKGFVFPGQGTQEGVPAVAKGLLLSDRKDIARIANRTYEEADDTLRILLKKQSLNGSVHELTEPGIIEPAILTASIAALRVLINQGIKPDIVAGHSMGEISAVVAARSLTFEQALKLVRSRGEFMEKAGGGNPGSMSAVLGLTLQEVEEICKEAGVEVANINGPTQIVISGRRDSVMLASEIVKNKGKKVREIAVAIASHSSLMEPARLDMGRLLQEVPISDPQVHIIQNLTGDYAHSAVEVRSGLVNQMTRRVLWMDTIRRMSADGIDSYIEVGPGNVLSGLIRRIDPLASVSHAMDLIPRR